jgi:hypothetical protein
LAFVRSKLLFNFCRRGLLLAFSLFPFWFSAASACDAFLPKFAVVLANDQGRFFEFVTLANDASKYAYKIVNRQTNEIILQVDVVHSTQVLEFTIKSRDRFGKRLREDFNGSTLLEYMFEKLKSDGVSIKAIDTQFIGKEGLETSLAEFNRLTLPFSSNQNILLYKELASLLAYEATRSYKTAENPDRRPTVLQMLEKYGFKLYTVLHAMGTPGHYIDVRIRVTQPPTIDSF